jgi:hypothetical protein
MKKLIMLVLLYTTLVSCARSQSDFFELPNTGFKYSFRFNLTDGETMQIELINRSDIRYLRNTDSIVQLCNKDIDKIKDSLQEDLNARHINYVMDRNIPRRLRLTQHTTPYSQFIIADDMVGHFKTSQDTITITGTLSNGLGIAKLDNKRYFRISFFLNDLDNLIFYKGKLNEKISKLQAGMQQLWVPDKSGSVTLKGSPDISAPSSGGYSGLRNLFILRLSVDIQNYKTTFVPSISTGVSIIKRGGKLIREYGFLNELHFQFIKNTEGRMSSEISSFVSASYGRSVSQTNAAESKIALFPFVSLGYLVNRKSEAYDLNTFKLGLGRFSFAGGSTKIEPVIYFNNFFKGASPALRLVQRF